ncbi:MAG TPA: CBS domain-containing protein [Sandaracinaceae bacterium LLY-WYZ-13_1]|nr:CBS domain-containing protein [Sandaracinaceae bacterium LLY-WYZ-13_1]
MGEHSVTERSDETEARAFMKALLADVRALELMLDRDLIESGTRRVGAEQEMFLVDADSRPAPVACDLLDELDERRLTTELARFNVEANIDPRTFTGTALREMEQEVRALVHRTDQAAKRHHARVLLAGILPTLRRGDLTLENMTPIPRYRALNDTLMALRGGDVGISIKGIDELAVTHDNVMFEACNTSFQVHFQVAPYEFAKLYNVAQLVTAPVLAAAANSPLLFGSRLWHETRVALFSSSIDDRSSSRQARGFKPRVTFGDQWVQKSVLEIFREQIARFRVVLSAPATEDPVAAVQRGEVPELNALKLHNGTVYRWNRACYGTKDGVAHLRIENRVLPAGPSILDEVANAAFFFGLMAGVVEELGDPRERLDFDDAKDNFFAAARHGLKAQFTWPGGETLTAAELIRDRLLPLAREGLEHSRIDGADIDRYLGVIAARVGAGRTGASWMLDSLSHMSRRTVSGDMRERRLVGAMLEHQQENRPVHEWAPCSMGEMTEQEDEWRRGLQRVGQFMSTDLFTVRPNDLVDLAASVMDWEHIKHVPVEDDDGHLVGLVTHRDLLRLVARGTHESGDTLVRDIMIRDPMTVSPKTRTLEAMRLMREHGIGCLPVVEDERLVGIITQSDLIAVSSHLLEKFLEGER